MPDSLLVIGSDAFGKNKGIKVIGLPSSLETIGDSAFRYCDGLTEVTVPDNLSAQIGSSMFAYCTGLTEVTIPDNLKEQLGPYMFAYCTSLTEVRIPDNLKVQLGPYTFAYCTGLTELVLPSDFTGFRNSFYGCTNVEKITYRASGNGIMADRDSSSSGASEIYMYSNMPEYDVRNSLKEIVFEEGITRIAGYLCGDVNRSTESCAKLERVVFPSTVTEIGKSSFYKCTALYDYTLPIGLTEIGRWAFYNCEGPETLELPESLITIDEYAFYGNKGITAISLPSTLKTIGVYTFGGCEGIATLTIPNQIESVGNRAFQNCTGLTTLILPSDITGYSNSFSGCTNVEKITYRASADGVMADRINSNGYSIYIEMPEYDVRESLKEIVFEEGITHIASYLCGDSSNSNRQSCINLERVVLPSTVTDIGISSYYGCTALNTVLYNGSLYTKQLLDLNIPNISDDEWIFTVTETMQLPQGLTQFKANALRGTRTQQIIVPAATETILDYAFADCEELRILLVMGMDTVIADNALSDSPNVRVFCPDGSAVHTWCLNNNIACTAF